MRNEIRELQTEVQETRRYMDTVIAELKATFESTKADAMSVVAQESVAQFDKLKADLVAAAMQSFKAELDAKLEALSTNILSTIKSCKCTSKNSA